MELIHLLIAKLKSWLMAPSTGELMARHLETLASLQAEAAVQHTAQIEAFASAFTTQAGVMERYFKQFEITSPPEVRIMRDEDMLRAEMRRAGVPEAFLDSPLAQSNFVLSRTADPSYDLDPAFFAQ